MEFSYKNSLLKNSTVIRHFKNLDKAIQNAASATYADSYASVLLPFDKNYLTQIKALVKKKQALNPGYIVVIGIGGSNLGTIAVQEAVLGRLYNQLSPKTKILYADTCDPVSVSNILEIITPALKRKSNVLLNVITKSGTTAETIANFKVLLSTLKKYKKDYKKYVVVITDSYSRLWQSAKDDFDILDIPGNVGGRYSVFSAVGIFPLAMLGIDIDGLLSGARNAFKVCTSHNIKNNPAALSAIVQYLHYSSGKNVSDLFLFSPELESVGRWYRQLMGESIGKERNLRGKKVNVGITPTYSIGSTDLHSVAQLYLAGPYDKLTTFVSVKTQKTDLNSPNDAIYLEMLKNKSFSFIMNAILLGTKSAFRSSKRAFMEVKLDALDEYSVGEFLQFKMLEMMYLGSLLNINAFDQPNVEEYKTETKKILER